MKVWLVRDLEPLPIDSDKRRIMRMGMLAKALARRHHSTHWITSSFDHYRKRQREPRAQEFSPEENLKISVLPGLGYKRNIGLRRVWHNRDFAKKFSHFAAASQERPDVIVVDLPTTEAAASAVAFGKERNIPTILSIRDLWPDFFADRLPKLFHPLANLALSPLRQQARYACNNATCLVGTSESYLNWGLDYAKRQRTDLDRVAFLGYAPQQLLNDENAHAYLHSIGVRPDCRLISFIGSWNSSFNFQPVLEAARRLVDRTNVQFVIAGEGEAGKLQMQKLRGLPNVLLPGWIGTDQIAAILNRSEVGLLPYRKGAPQGLPNKVFEYYAYGAYQIASLQGDAKAFYKKTGAGEVLSQSVSGDELTQAIVKRLDNPETAALRGKQIADFNSEYHSDVVYDRFAKHIETIFDRFKDSSA